MGRVQRFDHIGITVADPDWVTAFFVALGLKVIIGAWAQTRSHDAPCR